MRGLHEGRLMLPRRKRRDDGDWHTGDGILLIRGISNEWHLITLSITLSITDGHLSSLSDTVVGFMGTGRISYEVRLREQAIVGIHHTSARTWLTIYCPMCASVPSPFGVSVIPLGMSPIRWAMPALITSFRYYSPLSAPGLSSSGWMPDCCRTHWLLLLWRGGSFSSSQYPEHVASSWSSSRIGE